ncbi:MAG: ribosomal L7Ae/L30e/S12e/Gadd45 family protein [Clostridia bacterium]
MEEIYLKITNAKDKYVGFKQLKREAKTCDVDYVVLADDAESEFKLKVEKICADKGLTLFYAPKKLELGKAAGISICSAVVTVLKSIDNA